MTLDVQLKAGFFKTRRYYLTVGHGQILLTPRETDLEEFIIDNNELISICIFKKGGQTGEIEIITHSRAYIVTFTIQSGLAEVYYAFAKEFGSIVTFQ